MKTCDICILEVGCQWFRNHLDTVTLSCVQLLYDNGGVCMKHLLCRLQGPELNVQQNVIEQGWSMDEILLQHSLQIARNNGLSIRYVTY